MGRSPGFVSNPCDSCALFRLAFAAAPGVTPLTWPQRLTRRLILQKARRQAFRGAHGAQPGIALRPLVSVRFQVLFHSANSRSFHLSLTVLVHYRSPRVFSLGRWTSLLPAGLACPAVLKVNGGRFRSSHDWPFLSSDLVQISLPTGLSPSVADLSSIFRPETGFVTP